jgi:serine/threonine protein kinase
MLHYLIIHPYPLSCTVLVGLHNGEAVSVKICDMGLAKIKGGIKGGDGGVAEIVDRSASGTIGNVASTGGGTGGSGMVHSLGVASNNNNTTTIGTPCWAAPEVLCNRMHSRAADVWSFGVVCWEVITLHQPFMDIPPSVVRHAIAYQNLRLQMPFYAQQRPAIAGMLAQCLHEDPEARPTFAELNHRLHYCLNMEQNYEPQHASDTNGSGGLTRGTSTSRTTSRFHQRTAKTQKRRFFSRPEGGGIARNAERV